MLQALQDRNEQLLQLADTLPLAEPEVPVTPLDFARLQLYVGAAAFELGKALGLSSESTDELTRLSVERAASLSPEAAQAFRRTLDELIQVIPVAASADEAPAITPVLARVIDINKNHKQSPAHRAAAEETVGRADDKPAKPLLKTNSRTASLTYKILDSIKNQQTVFDDDGTDSGLLELQEGFSQERGVKEQADVAAINALWDEYKRTGSSEIREQLIINYMPLVKYIAGRMSVGLPQHIEHADLVSYGIFGLMDAIEKFDIERKVKFETYAISRIKGAIIDELRGIDWVPRSVRTKARSVEKAFAALEAKLLRTPTDAEVAEQMGLSEEELQRVFNQISFIGVAALDEVLSANGERNESVTLGDTIAHSGQGPATIVEAEEMKQVLPEVINRLGDREKIVLTLYYYEGRKLAEIGEALGVTESRACQIHRSAIERLRSAMHWLER